MWRTTKDISMEIEATWADVVENLDETAGLARFAGPGGWNDADMLEVRHACAQVASAVVKHATHATGLLRITVCRYATFDRSTWRAWKQQHGRELRMVSCGAGGQPWRV